MCSSYFSTAEVARLFAPYNRGSNTTRGSNIRSIRHQHHIQRTSFTHTFCVLSDHNATKIPSIQEKADLKTSGLGEKRMSFTGLCTIYHCVPFTLYSNVKPSKYVQGRGSDIANGLFLNCNAQSCDACFEI